MKTNLLTALFLSLLLSCQPSADKTIHLSDWVDPFIGASTSTGDAGTYHGLGKTFPGAASPFGMTQVSPNTITGGDNAPGYSYEHTSIEGFAFTQMSGVGWYGDLGNFLVMPTTGELHTAAGRADHTDEGYRSRYDKESETARAGYYSVFLTDYNIQTEMTVAPHSGILRFTFPESKQSRIQIDLARRVGGTSTWQKLRVIDDHTISGYMRCTPEGGGWGNGAGNANYTVYFYAQFSKPLKDFGVWSADIGNRSRKLENVPSREYQETVADAEIIRGVREYEGQHIGFFTEFDTKADEVVLLKAGISFVDEAGAEQNLKAEIKDFNFDRTYARVRESWDKALSKISITGGTDDERRIFYTALYHTMIDPRLFSDVDGRYPGGDEQIHTSDLPRRTIFSGWDVFRSQMPLQTIINPDLIGETVHSLTELADETGREYYERWELLNAYSGCMVGNPAVSVLADAYAKGIRGYDVDKAYRYAVNSSERFGNDDSGYCPHGPVISNTLEYGYTEWCVAQLARALGNDDEEEKYLRRSQSYRNLWDEESGWFRPRNRDGEFEPLPSRGRLQEGYGCTESNPFQQGWFVPHDVDGLAELMGGREQAVAELDTMFARTPSHFLWNEYYNHANEPVHHIPFLYNRLGQPWKTQYWSRYICQNAYRTGVNGLVGNEDVGQMSAWYVLAAAGIHPVCPGDTRFEITSPVFDEVKFILDNGNVFTIRAHNNSPENVYIQKLTLNGAEYKSFDLDYFDIMNGGTLEMELGPEYN